MDLLAEVLWGQGEPPFSSWVGTFTSPVLERVDFPEPLEGWFVTMPGATC